MKHLRYILLMLLLLPGLSFAQKHVISRPSSSSQPKATQKAKPAPKAKAKTPAKRTAHLQEPTGYYDREPLADETFTVGDVSFVMVGVTGGVFTMGATPEQESKVSDELPLHRVAIGSFYIGQTEVTQALWQAVMGDNPSKFKGEELPVEQVSWDDCQEFISRLNKLTGLTFRLPTEAEWEYAARGGVKTRGYKYAGSDNLYNVAWYDGNSGDRTHLVATKQPNELGIYDMSGNVREWCQDWYNEYTASAQTNPWGPPSGNSRMERGASWFDLVDGCRTAYRGWIPPDSREAYVGLRLALSPYKNSAQ